MVGLGYVKWQLRRGKLELDVVLQRFVGHYPLDGMSDAELTALDHLLAATDDELLDLFLRRTVAPQAEQAALVEKILAAPIRTSQ